MADGVRTETLRIIIEAQNRAAKQLAEVGAEAEATGGRISRAFAGLKLGAGVLGVGAAATLIAATKAASDFNTMIVQVQGNTVLTNAQTAAMKQTILAMSAATGAPLDQLAQGFMHITNLGFSAADSTKILQVAMESALSTGSNVGDVANTLALQMHDFGLGANQAGLAMNVLHLAAAEGNATLEQFVGSTSKAVTTAANLHVPLVQVDAALAALSRHMPLAQASTALAGAFSKIINPAKATQAELLRLQETTGVPLVEDFTAAGLASKGLTGILDDLTRATHGNATEIMKLLPATRGGLAALVLTGTAAGDYASILKDLNATMEGKTNPTQAAFARQQATTGAAVARLTATFHVMAIEVGSAVLPVLNNLLQAVAPVVAVIGQWVDAHPQLTAAILGTVAALGLLAGGLTVLEIIAGPIVGVLGAIGAPVIAIAAAAALLYEAWTHDWGGIREITAQAWSALQPAFQQIDAAIQKVVAAFKMGGLGAAAQVALQQAQMLLGQLGDWIGSTGLPYLQAHLAVWAQAFANWVVAAGGDLLGKAGHQIDLLVAWMHSRAALQVLNAAAVWSSNFVNWVVAAGGDLLGKAGHQIDLFVAYMRGPAGQAILREAAGWAVDFANWVVQAGGDLLGLAGHQIDLFVAYMRGPAGQAILAQLGIWAIDFADWVITAGANLLTNAITAVGNLLGYLGNQADKEINKELLQLLADMEAPFKNLGSWAKQVGIDLVQGLINGMGSMAGSLASTAKNLVTGSVQGVWNNTLGRLSPSRWAHQFGVDVVQGAINGLTSMNGALSAASLTTASTITAGFSVALTKAMGATSAGIATAGQARTLDRGAISERTKALKDLADAAKWEQQAGIAHTPARAHLDLKRMDLYRQKADIALQAAGIIAGYAIRADAQAGVDATSATSVLAWATSMSGMLTSSVAQQAVMNARNKAMGTPVDAFLSLGAAAMGGGGGAPSAAPLGGGGGTVGSVGGAITVNVTIERGAILVGGAQGDDRQARDVAKRVGDAVIQAITGSQLRHVPRASVAVPGSR